MAAAQTDRTIWDSLAHPESAPELLSWRRTQPDGEFLVTDEERLSFAEADAQSRRLADALLASGVGRGSSCVFILFPNCSQWLACVAGRGALGARPMSRYRPSRRAPNSLGCCATPTLRCC